MRKHVAKILIALAVLMLAGCDQKALIRRYTPESDDKLAREFLEDIRRGQMAEARGLFDAGLLPLEADQGLRELAKLFNGGELKGIEVIGVDLSDLTSGQGNRKTVTLSYQLQLSTGWFAGSIVVVQSGVRGMIKGANFKRYPDNLETIHRFTFEGKGVLNMVFFALSLALPIFVISTFVLCVRSKIRRKWLWAAFVLLGFAGVSLNWTTGEIINYQLLTFRLLAAGIIKTNPYWAWVLTISFPVGAIVFLIRRKHLIQVEAPSQDN